MHPQKTKKTILSLILFIISLQFFDRLLEACFKSYLESKKDDYIQRWKKKYQERYGYVDEAFVRDLETDIEGVFPLNKKSILRERIVRAKYTFFLTMIAGVAFVGAMNGFVFGSIFHFINPIYMAIVNWVVAMATIPLGYKFRVEGGLDRVLARHERMLRESSSAIIIQGLQPKPGQPLPANKRLSKPNDIEAQEPLYQNYIGGMNEASAHKGLDAIVHTEPQAISSFAPAL